MEKLAFSFDFTYVKTFANRGKDPKTLYGSGFTFLVKRRHLQGE